MTRSSPPGSELPWSSTELGEEATIPSPRHTIIPTTQRQSAGRRAIAALERLRNEQGAGLGAALELGVTLGEGGMGVVRLATQVSLGRKVAVKTLRPQRTSDDATPRAPGDARPFGPASSLDLLQEAWITGALEHPNVVPVYSLGVEPDGRPVVVFRHIEGARWTDLMHDPVALKKRFGETDPLEWNLGILIQVLHALAFAHSRGILHRDVKPDNVMIGEFGQVYLLDWGIAVSLRDDGTDRLPLASEARETAGTPCYMAPEMIGGSGEPLAETTDVYLAGAVLYEVLSGRPPHDGATVEEVVRSIRASTPPMPPEAPIELCRICRRAMDADPSGRFERVEQLRLAIGGYLRHRGATRLAEHAARRLDELRAALDTPGGGDPDARLRIYKLFGECRFGFRESLAAAHDHDIASEGLRSAVTAMTEYELANGAPDAAAALLADLSAPHPELELRVEAALRARDDHRQRVAELERLGRDLDMSVGQRTRTLFVVLLGLMWSLFPLAGELAFRGAAFTYDRMIWWALGLALMVVPLAVWARESMFKTAVNRRLLGAVFVVFGAQVALSQGARWLGVDVVAAQTLHPLVWSVVTFMIVLTVDPRLWPTAIAQLAAFLFAARWPDLRFYAMSAGNLALTINGFLIWRPRPR